MTMSEFDEARAKAKLERAIHQPVGAILPSVWTRYLKSDVRQCLQGEPGAESWEEIKGMAKGLLKFQKEVEMDLAGGYPEEPEEAGGDSPPHEPDEAPTPKGLSGRTKARGRAMSELSAFRTGVVGEPPQIEPVKARVRSAGGRKDGTLHRWVVSLDIEVWVPAEEVARVYRNLQRQFIAKQRPGTEEGTYEVAQFVWRELRTSGGGRVTWPSLLERWKQEHPDDRRFKTYNNFRQFFVRGEEATVPHYKWPTIQTSPEQEAETQRMKERWIARLRRYEEEHGNQFSEEHRVL